MTFNIKEKNSENTSENPKKSTHHDHTVTICLIGDSQVGKTQISNIMLTKPFQAKYQASITAIDEECILERNGKKVKVIIWTGCSSSKKFEEYYKSNLGKADAVLVVCDLTQPKTFDHYNDHLSDVTQANEPDKKPIVCLVGNKTDLHDSRQVHSKRLTYYANEQKLSSAFVSAKTGENIKELLETVVDEALKNQENKARNDPKKSKAIQQLETYIKRIESHKTIDNKIDFGHGFWIAKESRSINRRINYTLAKHLLSELLTPKSVLEVFKDEEAIREKIIKEEKFNTVANYVSRGLNSQELKTVIFDAKKLCKELRENKPSSEKMDNFQTKKF